MAIVTGNDYDHIDIVNGSTQTRHMIKDASARADVADLKSALDARTLFGGTTDAKDASSRWRKGYTVNSVGRYGSKENSVSGAAGNESKYIYAGSTITANTGYKFNYSILTIPIPSSGTPDAANRLEVMQNITAGTTITVAHDGYLGLSVMYDDEGAISDNVSADDFIASALTVNLHTASLKEKVEEHDAEIADHEERIATIESNTSSLKYTTTDANAASSRWRKGYFVNSSGRYGSWENNVSGAPGNESKYIYAGSTITANTGYKFNYSILTIPIPSSGNPTTDQKLEVMQNITAGTTITIAHDGYLGISAAYADESAISSDISADDFIAAALSVNLIYATVKEKVEEHDAEIADHEERIATIESDASSLSVITNPRLLRWCFGSFSASGSNSFNNNGMIWRDTLHVLPGTTVTTLTGAEMQTRFTPDGGTGDYKTFRTGEFTVTEAGNLKVGVRYTEQTPMNNTAILDLLSLHVVTDSELPIDENAQINTMYGNVPCSDYVGRHTDDTQCGQTTTYDDAIAFWKGLPALAPGYIVETDLGEIQDVGKHTYKYVLTPPMQGRSGKNMPHVFLVTSQHGHEKSATYGLYYLIMDMLNHSQEDPVLFYLRNFVKFTILPMVNPYGWDRPGSNTQYFGIRQNENGVNLNRNFAGLHWSDYDDNEDYNTVGSYYYRGTSPFSEIETQRIRDAFIADQTVDLMIDLHTNGIDTTQAPNITYIHVAGTNKTGMATNEAADQYMCANKLHMDNLYEVNLGNNVMYGTLVAPSDPHDLKCVDWGCESAKVCGVTFEVPPGSTTGYLGTKLSKYSPDLIKLCGEMIGNFIVKILFNIGKLT